MLSYFHVDVLNEKIILEFGNIIIKCDVITLVFIDIKYFTMTNNQKSVKH